MQVGVDHCRPGAERVHAGPGVGLEFEQLQQAGPSASANCSTLNGPGAARWAGSTPTLIAPIRSGNENTAPTPRPRAAGVNTGQREKAVERSGIRTGDPPATASQDGPSPRVNCASSNVALVFNPPQASTTPWGPMPTPAQIPSTSMTVAAAPAAAGTSPPGPSPPSSARTAAI
ncbi:MAG TPA: hypothetical protein VGX23_30455 [Actinocrinis sp.]|nr:hypothetical protein [Actinocrinis sp.]